MINRVLNFSQNVNFELNLYELIMGLSAIVLIAILVITVNKIARTIIKERTIDEHMRKTRARIARVVSEIDEFKELNISGEEMVTEIADTSPIIPDTKRSIEDQPSNLKEQGQVTQKKSEELPRGKKTRAMPMEERWAEFDKKRSRTNTA